MDRIREVRLELASGTSMREVARKYGMSRRTVRKIVRSQATRFEYRRTGAVRHPALESHMDKLIELLDIESRLPPRQRRTAQRLFEELCRSGYKGSYSSVQRYVRTWKREHGSTHKAHVPLVFARGDAFQFDFSHEHIEIAGEKKIVPVAHFRLCHSRKEFCVALRSEATEMVMQAHVLAHDYFGGLCARGIYDNLKAVVTHVGKGKERDFNQHFLQLASHYLFKSEACTPGAGWEKGQVERQVGSIRDRYFRPCLSFASLAELNAHLAAKADDEARLRQHPEFSQKTIWEVYQEEKPYLRRVRAPFDACTHFVRRVSTHCLVEVDGTRYSAPCSLAGKVVSVRKYAETIAIYDEGREVARHERSFDKGRYVLDMQHYLHLLERKPGAVRNGRPFQTLPAALEQVRETLQRFTDWDRQMADILTAISRYGLEAVCTACELALENRIVSSTVILNYLSRLTETARPVSIPAPPCLTLKHPPLADCARYDELRAVAHA